MPIIENKMQNHFKNEQSSNEKRFPSSSKKTSWKMLRVEITNLYRIL